MKKLLLLLIACISVPAFAQDSLDFNTHFSPQKKYSETITQNTTADINYKGSDDFLQKLKDKGISNPTKQTKSTVLQEDVKTGKMKTDSIFPLTMQIMNATDTNVMKYLPNGTIIYGNCKSGSMPLLDSMLGNNDDDNMKSILIKSMESMISQIKLPHRKLAPGQTITITDPLTMPIASITLNMMITTNYTLKKINSDGTATIAITQSYTMQTDASSLSSTASGNGAGEIIYDAKNNFYKKYNLDLTLKMNVKFSDDAAMDYTSSVGYTQTVDISNNK